MHRSRSFRRDQKDRKRIKYKKILITERAHYGAYETTAQLEERAARMATTPHPNKCQCCCNPRHSIWYNNETKLTLQERQAKDSENTQIEEIDFFLED